MRQRTADERGVTLILAMIVMLALTITTAGLATMMTSNERSFNRDRQETIALNVAEAGVNYAVTTLTSVDSTGSLATGTHYPSSGTLAGQPGTGTVAWWAEKLAGNVWKVHSTGSSVNSNVTRNVVVKVQATPQPGTITPASLAWGYGLFVAAPTSCFKPAGTADISMSVFVNGDICLSGSAGIQEPTASTSPSIKVFSTGKITLSGSSKIGLSTKKVLSITTQNGCTNKSGVICSSPTSGVYACPQVPAPPSVGVTCIGGGYNTSGSTITKPAIDPPGVYAMGDWSTPTCTTGSFTFDNDLLRNSSVSGANLFPASSYDCTITKLPSTATVGRLIWNAGTKKLTVSGTIFIDGSMSIASNTSASYGTSTTSPSVVSDGAIYLNGTMTTNGGSTLCGPPATTSGSACTTPKWDPAQGKLLIAVINAGSAGTAWKMNGNAEYNVMAYVVGNYDNSGTAFVTGPVITDQASVGGTAAATDSPTPPATGPGAQSTSAGTALWAVIPRTWQQLPSDPG